MTDVLGYPLNRALAVLRAEGLTVKTVEVSSRKGSAGQDARVIRTERNDADVTVYWSRFRTTTEQ